MEASADLRWLRALMLLVGAHLVIWGLTVYGTPFNADEHQHTHLAWHMSQGRLVYRDVFDHHGPIYTLWNGWLLSLLRKPERFDVVYLLRMQSVLVLIAVAAATHQLARRVHDDRRVAWLATAMLTGSVLMADKGAEVRPDGLQTLWTVLGLGLLLGSGRWALIAGVCFGLAGASNIKGLVGPAVATAVWCTSLAWDRGPAAAVRQGAAVAAGTLGVLGAFVAGFASAGAARDLIYYNITFNLNAASSAPDTSFSAVCVWYALVHQTALVLWMVVGTAGAAVERQGVGRRAAPLIAAVLVLTWTGHQSDQFGQFYVTVVPLVAVIGAAGAPILAAWLEERRPWVRRAWLPAAVLLNLWLTAELVGWYRDREPDPRPRQVTDWVLKHLRRDEPVAYMWNDCAGFQFNVDAQYFWCRLQENFGEASAAQAYGRSFRDALEAQQVQVIVATDANLRELPDASARYVRSRYVRRGSCLLVRDDSPLARGDAAP
jgi:hypothetical protein